MADAAGYGERLLGQPNPPKSVRGVNSKPADVRTGATSGRLTSVAFLGLLFLIAGTGLVLAGIDYHIAEKAWDAILEIRNGVFIVDIINITYAYDLFAEDGCGVNTVLDGGKISSNLNLVSSDSSVIIGSCVQGQPVDIRVSNQESGGCNITCPANYFMHLENGNLGYGLSMGYNHTFADDDSHAYSAILSGSSNGMLDSRASVVSGGRFNVINDTFCAHIGAGYMNYVSAGRSAIIIGEFNSITGTGNASMIGAGKYNSITDGMSSGIFIGYDNNITTGINSVIVSGSYNLLTDSVDSIIAAGNNNTVTTTEACFIGSGELNVVSESVNSAILVGSRNNLASVTNAVIMGGTLNIIASSSNAAIVTGTENVVSVSDSSMIGAGDTNNITNSFASFIGAGDFNTIVATGADYFCNAIVAGYGNAITDDGFKTYYNFIGSGLQNTISGGEYNTIVAGRYNTITDSNSVSFVSGQYNVATGSRQAVIGSGYQNNITDSSDTFIGAGTQNVITTGDVCAIVAGVGNNIIQSDGVFIGGGVFHTVQTASAYSAIVTGSLNNITASQYAFIGTGYLSKITNSNYAAILTGSESSIDSAPGASILTGSTLTVTGPLYTNTAVAQHAQTRGSLSTASVRVITSTPITVSTGDYLFISNAVTATLRLGGSASTQDGMNIKIRDVGNASLNPITLDCSISLCIICPPLAPCTAAGGSHVINVQYAIESYIFSAATETWYAV